MLTRTRRFPPLKALAAFETAARSMSFSDAAREMNVTRVAISRQVRQLEEYIGIQLFHRGSSDIRLTSAGKRLHKVVSHGFQAILDEIDAITNVDDSHLITLATTAGVSTYWLMPIIGRYREIEPSVDFRLLCSYELIDLERWHVDVSIRYGDGDWPELDCREIMRQQVLPVSSRTLMGRIGPVDSLSDLSALPLLEYESAADQSSFWPNYLKDHDAFLSDPPRKCSYESYINFVQAVLEGQGIGLLGPPLMNQFLQSGVLVPVVDVEPTDQRSYFLCRPKNRPRSPMADSFAEWLFAEMQSDGNGILAAGGADAMAHVPA